MKMNTLAVIFPIIIGCLGLSCDKGESEIIKNDFISFELSATKRTYVSKDSVLQFCEPSRIYKDQTDFYISKTYNSSDNQFHSLTVILRQSSKTCPDQNLHDDFDLAFTLTQVNANRFIDYTNLDKLAKVHWTQKYDQGKIIVAGTFEGWLFKYYPMRVRTSELNEPEKIDSLFIKNGSFQLSIE